MATSISPAILKSLTPAIIQVLLDGPAATPPPGVVPNFNHSITSFPGDIALLAIALAIMTFAIGVRIYSRWYLAKSRVLEDYMILLVWALEVAYVGLSFVAAKNGAGAHMWNNKLGSVIQMSKRITIASTLYYPAILLTKVAILRQFLRVFAPNFRHNPLMFWACWLVIFLTALCYTVLLGISLGQCHPWNRIWNPFIVGNCIVSNERLAIIVGWINVASDILILILPLPCMYTLNMRWKKKLAISCLFLAGILACVASALRLYYTYTTIRSFDVSYHFSVIGIITVYEVCLGALVLCLPTFPKVFSLLRGKLQVLFKPHGEKHRPASRSLEEGAIREHKALGSPQAATVGSLDIPSIAQYLGKADGESDKPSTVSLDTVTTKASPASSDGILINDGRCHGDLSDTSHV